MKKLLLVDDSATARKLILTHLEGLKVTVVEAVDGKDALRSLENNPDIALIFSDINMPEMNGLEMVAALKQNPKFAKIPVCMLTTETGSDELQRAKTLGVNAFLVKPVKREQVLAVVNGFLQGK